MVVDRGQLRCDKNEQFMKLLSNDTLEIWRFPLSLRAVDCRGMKLMAAFYYLIIFDESIKIDHE